LRVRVRARVATCVAVAFSVWMELRVRVRARVATCVAVAFSVWTQFTVPTGKRR
jgi:hypothetical protein